VLHAFKEWGEECLDRLVGMFAFSVYDRKTDTLTLARDRFGKKPLYYSCRGGHVLFASELKTLLSHCDKPVLNKQRLIEWSLYRNIDFGAPDTLIEGVSTLLPGHYLKVSRGHVCPPVRYYSPEAQVDRDRYDRFTRQGSAEISNEVESLIVDSVRARLVSDVPVGTFCSGGIDSSLVTALAARHKKNLVAFHVSVAGYTNLDESRYARQVTDAVGAELKTYSLGGEAFRRALPRAIYHSDVPLAHANSVAFLLLSDFARSHGVKLLLSGEAADELFGGYMQRYRRARQILMLKRWASYLPPKIRKSISLAATACNGVPFMAVSEYQGLLAHSTMFLDRFARESLLLRCTDAYRFVSKDSERVVLAAMLADLTNFLAPLLRRLDRMSMAASIECRVPFLDHRLVETVINLPLHYRLRGLTDKWLLKQIAARHLPGTIVHRRKLGFPLPLADYLAPLARAGYFQNGFCEEYLGLQRRGLDDAIGRWRENVDGFFNLLALEIWGRLYFLGQSLEEVTDQCAGSRTRVAS
jgi:asparagine synthase (glutamine-hydrolysing)